MIKSHKYLKILNELRKADLYDGIQAQQNKRGKIIKTNSSAKTKLEPRSDLSSRSGISAVVNPYQVNSSSPITHRAHEARGPKREQRARHVPFQPFCPCV